MPAQQVLRMMTMGGAKAAGLDHEVGSIKSGKKADIILLNQEVPHVYPANYSDPMSRIVYEHQSRDVDTVIIDGNVLLCEGRFLNHDEKEILYQSEEALSSLLNRLSDPIKSGWKY